MFKIGTRGSKLALWQAEFTQAALQKIGVESELVIIKTQGDLIQHLSFEKMEGKGFFTKEIEDALLRGEVQVAVHSMKDLPTSQPEGLAITAVSYRDNPADLLIIRPEAVQNGQIFKVKQGAIVGTSAARRKAQLLDYRPDVQLKDIRGRSCLPVAGKTRPRGVRRHLSGAAWWGAWDSAQCGLVVGTQPRGIRARPGPGRSGLANAARRPGDPHDFKHLHQSEISGRMTNMERRVLQLMDGGCQLPLGCNCHPDASGNYHVFAACELEGELLCGHKFRKAPVFDW